MEKKVSYIIAVINEFALGKLTKRGSLHLDNDTAGKKAFFIHKNDAPDKQIADMSHLY